LIGRVAGEGHRSVTVGHLGALVEEMAEGSEDGQMLRRIETRERRQPGGSSLAKELFPGSVQLIVAFAGVSERVGRGLKIEKVQTGEQQDGGGQPFYGPLTGHRGQAGSG